MIRDQSALNDLLQRTRRFVRDVAIPNEDRVEREDKVGDDLVAELRRLGTFGWSIPQAYGGSELTTEELALAFMELTQCSVAFRVVGAALRVRRDSLHVQGTTFDIISASFRARVHHFVCAAAN